MTVLLSFVYIEKLMIIITIRHHVPHMRPIQCCTVGDGSCGEQGLTMAAGQTPVQKYWKHLLNLIEKNELDPTVVRHLSSAPLIIVSRQPAPSWSLREGAHLYCLRLAAAEGLLHSSLVTLYSFSYGVGLSPNNMELVLAKQYCCHIIQGVDYSYRWLPNKLLDWVWSVECRGVENSFYVGVVMGHYRDLLQIMQVITHHMPLDQAAEGYKIFNDKVDNCMKVVLKP